ncbi:MAG: hypothetical protein NT016_02145 [Candidatus Aenigmarchaeota archaeon]|nr:hypothetical protein [Candidatus Aenigmarchaeota archaeon]
MSGSGQMTPGHIESYRKSGLANRLMMFLDDYAEPVVFTPATYGGVEAVVLAPTPESLEVMLRAMRARDAYNAAYAEFVSEYPECNVGVGVFRRACKYVSNQ